MSNENPYIPVVINLTNQHSNYWRDKSDDYWFYKLLEEVGELGASLANEHEHPPELELCQISAICLNWLDKRDRENET